MNPHNSKFMSSSSPWFEDDYYSLERHPFDYEPSEWFDGEDKHLETREPMDWGDPAEEKDDELPDLQETFAWQSEREESESEDSLHEASWHSEREEEEDSEMEYADDCESVNSIPMSLGSFSTQEADFS